MSYYDYDPNDIALSIQKAIEERAEPEAVSYLLEQRNKKIRENPGFPLHIFDLLCYNLKLDSTLEGLEGCL